MVTGVFKDMCINLYSHICPELTFVDALRCSTPAASRPIASPAPPKLASRAAGARALPPLLLPGREQRAGGGAKRSEREMPPSEGSASGSGCAGSGGAPGVGRGDAASRSREERRATPGSVDTLSWRPLALGEADSGLPPPSSSSSGASRPSLADMPGRSRLARCWQQT